jgi:hypothetical protein
MRYGVLFALIAVLFAATAAIHRGWLLVLAWPAASFALVAMAYFHLGPRVFGKSPAGRLSPISLVDGVAVHPAYTRRGRTGGRLKRAASAAGVLC